MRMPDFVKCNVPLSGYSTLGVGGLADFFVRVKNIEPDVSESADSYVKKVKRMFHIVICEACEFTRDNNLDIFILGRGSNVMFGDSGFRGLVLKIEMSRLRFGDDQLWAEAGAPVSSLVALYESGCTGMECFAGLPGTVGGAVCGNAGCYGGQFWDVVEEVSFFDGEYSRTQIKQDGMFGYRRSIFSENPGWVITGVRLKYEPKDSDLIIAETKRVRTLRQASQPKQKSAGCIFRNPSGGKGAGQLIDEAGLKGMSVGRAEISQTHANFFINNGGATAGDFIELIKIAKDGVFKKFGILLQEEIKMIGEF